MKFQNKSTPTGVLIRPLSETTLASITIFFALMNFVFLFVVFEFTKSSIYALIF